MAELTVAQKGGRRKPQAPRLDLTPMVDLGFILITFFIYTTTMAQPNTMEINMPSTEKTDNHTAFTEESTITLIPVSNHKVVYYDGLLKTSADLHLITTDKIRSVLTDRKRHAAALPAGLSKEAHKLHVLIKPDTNSKYADLVALLDEMNITDVPYYAIVDVTAEERTAIAGLH